MDNWPVQNNPWQKRIARAEQLLGQHEFAIEILGFYAKIVRFQESLYDRLNRAMAKWETPSLDAMAGPRELPELVNSFGSFLSMAERNGPARLGGAVRDLRKAGELDWSRLLDSFWSNSQTSPAGPAEFLARAFLQPYAELLRQQSGLEWNGYSYSLCPFCARRPAVGVLRQVGEGARRSMICSFCLAEWEFRRIVCPGCGEETEGKLPVYVANEFDHIRVECCDTCKKYIKSVDLTKNGLANPVVDEIASAPLDIWAQEHGYLKVEFNLVGL